MKDLGQVNFEKDFNPTGLTPLDQDPYFDREAIFANQELRKKLTTHNEKNSFIVKLTKDTKD